MVRGTDRVQFKCGRFSTFGANLFIFWRYNNLNYGIFICCTIQGYGLTEEAARLTIKRYRNPRFGQMCARSKHRMMMKVLHDWQIMEIHPSYIYSYFILLIGYTILLSANLLY